MKSKKEFQAIAKQIVLFDREYMLSEWDRYTPLELSILKWEWCRFNVSKVFTLDIDHIKSYTCALCVMYMDGFNCGKCPLVDTVYDNGIAEGCGDTSPWFYCIEARLRNDKSAFLIAANALLDRMYKAYELKV